MTRQRRAAESRPCHWGKSRLTRNARAWSEGSCRTHARSTVRCRDVHAAALSATEVHAWSATSATDMGCSTAARRSTDVRSTAAAAAGLCISRAR